MAVDFSRLTNTDLSTTPFQYVVFGKNGGLLEVELNEAQLLSYERQRSIIRLIGNMCSDISMFIYDKTTKVLTISSGILALNGYLINLSESVSISDVTDGSKVYATISLETLDKESVVNKFGLSSEDSIENTIEDNRVGIETTRRQSIKLVINTTESADSVLLGGITNNVFVSNLTCGNISELLKEQQESLNEINRNLEQLEYSDVAGIKNDLSKLQDNVDSSDIPYSAYRKNANGDITPSAITSSPKINEVVSQINNNIGVLLQGHNEQNRNLSELSTDVANIFGHGIDSNYTEIIGDDLNNMITGGSYMNRKNGIANLPDGFTRNEFQLIVLVASNSSYVIQYLIPWQDDKIYRRNRTYINGFAWSEWTCLQEKVDSIKKDLAIIGTNKNFLNCNLKSHTKDGITLTKNNDGSYTLNGTASKDTSFDISSNVSIKGNGKLKRNLIKLSGTCSKNITHVSYDSSWGYGIFTEMNTPYTLNNGIIFTVFRIDISNGTVCDNLKVAFIVNDNPTELCYYTGDGESLTADVSQLKNDLSEKLKVVSVSLAGIRVSENSSSSVSMPQEYIDAGYVAVNVLKKDSGLGYTVSSETSILVSNYSNNPVMFSDKDTIPLLIAKIG